MEYLDLERNIEYVLQTFGYIRKEQLRVFFADAANKEQLEIALNELIFDHKIKCDREKDFIAYHGSSKMSFTAREKLLDALWVLAHFHSESVLSVSVLAYPQQYVFSTREGDIYDVTVIADETDALLARTAIANARIEDEQDLVNHIAVVYDVRTGRKLGKYGFNNLVYFDAEKHLPHYEPLTDEVYPDV